MEKFERNILSIRRPIYNQKDLRKIHPIDYDFDSNGFQFSNFKRCLSKKFTPNRNCFLNFMRRRFPFTRWIFEYNLKENILKDLIAGLTVGVIQIAPSKYF